MDELNRNGWTIWIGISGRFQSERVDDFTRNTQSGRRSRHPLRQLMKETADIAVRHRKLTAISISHELLSGEMTVPALLLPLLHEIAGGRKSDWELRLLAFQFVTAMQVALLRAETFKRYSGVDPFVASEREAVIDFLVDHLVRNLTHS